VLCEEAGRIAPSRRFLQPISTTIHALGHRDEESRALNGGCREGEIREERKETPKDERVSAPAEYLRYSPP